MSDKHQTDQVKIPQVYAARTDVGCVREHNEDSFIAATPLFVVADGMGGHEAGEVASEIAINTLLEKAPSSPDGEGLANAVRAANIAIISAAAQGVGRPGMGTTMTAAQIFDDQLVIAQVGDSRAYLLHEGTLQRITRDHSLVADLIDQGRITEEEARRHPNRNLITRALGTDETVESDGYRTTLSEGEYLLLCTDGLTITVTDQEMLFEILHGGDEESCLSRLLAIAKEHGAPDNVTAVLMRQTEGGQ